MSPEVSPQWKQGPRPKKPRRPLRHKARNTGTRPEQEWSSDDDLKLSHQIVEQRSGGLCEHCRKARATNFHHLAGRGFAGCHHPLLIKHLCGQGNTSGCHKVAHSLPMRTARALGLRLPWGTTADDLAGAS